MHVNFYELGIVDDVNLAYAVILTRYNNQWIYVRHKERHTWEIPGGKREPSESIEDAARRELYEETGAISYRVSPVCVYSVKLDNNDDESYGALFYSEVLKFGQLPPESEIGQIKMMQGLPSPVELTYPGIQPRLYEKGIHELSLKE